MLLFKLGIDGNYDFESITLNIHTHSSNKSISYTTTDNSIINNIAIALTREATVQKLLLLLLFQLPLLLLLLLEGRYLANASRKVTYDDNCCYGDCCYGWSKQVRESERA